MLIRKTKYFSQLMRNICQELIMINDRYRMHVRKIKIITKINKNMNFLKWCKATLTFWGKYKTKNTNYSPLHLKTVIKKFQHRKVCKILSVHFTSILCEGFHFRQISAKSQKAQRIYTLFFQKRSSIYLDARRAINSIDAWLRLCALR